MVHITIHIEDAGTRNYFLSHLAKRQKAPACHLSVLVRRFEQQCVTLARTKADDEKMKYKSFRALY